MKKGLGRGISSLLPDEPLAANETSSPTMLKITDIEPNKEQPRKDFDKEKLSSLADSIKEYGLIQPLVVSEKSNGRYVIVAGERRWRAAKAAGLKEVPVTIKEYTKEEIAEIALIENLQREDLNPIEEALGYQSLLDDYNLTQEAVSKKLGKSRSAVANSLRLLSLDDEIKNLISVGKISSGHARAVLSLPTKEKRLLLAERIIAEDLSVRRAETLAKILQKEPVQKEKKDSSPTQYDLEMSKICERLSSKFGTKVTMSKGKNKRKIEIEYYNDKDLERIIDLLN